MFNLNEKSHRHGAVHERYEDRREWYVWSVSLIMREFAVFGCLLKCVPLLIVRMI